MLRKVHNELNIEKIEEDARYDGYYGIINKYPRTSKGNNRRIP